MSEERETYTPAASTAPAHMTDGQLLIIEARAGVVTTAMPYPGMWQLDTSTVDFLRNDVPALVTEAKRQRDMLHAFYLACVYLDKAVPVYGRTNIERIRFAADEITKLRADVERIGRERDDMARANVELQERLTAAFANTGGYKI